MFHVSTLPSAPLSPPSKHQRRYRLRAARSTCSATIRPFRKKFSVAWTIPVRLFQAQRRRPRRSAACRAGPRREGGGNGAPRCSPARSVNATEHRPALHMVLRNFTDAPMLVDGKDVMPEVCDLRPRRGFAAAVRSGEIRGARRPITDVVNIGIGGSDPGRLRRRAPVAIRRPADLRPHFVSNGRRRRSRRYVARADPARDAVHRLVQDVHDAGNDGQCRLGAALVADALSEAAVADHFAAVSTRSIKVAGVRHPAGSRLRLLDWVGGRYSMWSAIGLSLVIAIGPEHFEDFLARRAGYRRPFPRRAAGGQHPRSPWCCFRRFQAPAMSGTSRSTWSSLYDQRLARFPAYLQQLDMESNGKSRHRDGAAVATATGPFVFGEPRHQRTARLLPVAAPGDRHRAHRFSSWRPSRRSRRRPPCAAEPIAPAQSESDDARPQPRREVMKSLRPRVSPVEIAALAPQDLSRASGRRRRSRTDA